MSETRFHGARVTENTDLVTAINDVDSSVIGIVATADDADAKLFPLNKPTLLTRVNDVLGKCGTTGTLYRALKAIADQVSTKVIVVRVAEHKEEDGKTQDQLVIGGSEDDGSYTGMYALLVAEQDESIGYRPRILAAPELDVYARLTGAQLRNRLEPDKGVFIAESPKVIDRALALHRPAPADPVGVLAAVGGLDLAAMTGAFLGCAQNHVPAVVDGYISIVAALTAVRLCPAAGEYLFLSHASYEIGYRIAAQELGQEPCLLLGMRLGEGSGCPVMFQILRAACAVMDGMATFPEAAIEDDYLAPIRAQDSFTVTP